MLYALLCYNEEDVVWSWSKEQDQAVMTRLGGIQDRLSKAGKMGPSLRLLPTTSATISMFVRCETQEEVDDLWEKLSAGGQMLGCGWVTDKYGVTWQIVPSVLGEMLQDKDAAKANRVMQALLKMEKLDIARLKQAYDQT